MKRVLKLLEKNQAYSPTMVGDKILSNVIKKNLQKLFKVAAIDN